MIVRVRNIFAVLLVLAVARASFASDCCQSQPVQNYRISQQTVYEQQPITSYRLQYQTVLREQQVTSWKPVWETQMRERRYTVAKPVVEIAAIPRETEDPALERCGPRIPLCLKR